MGILEGEPEGVSLFRHQARTKNACPYITRGEDQGSRMSLVVQGGKDHLFSLDYGSATFFLLFLVI